MAVKSLEEQLTRIALKKVKLPDGKTLEETMAEEARKLYDCIQYYIDKYYESYHPRVYERYNDYYRGALYAEDLASIRVVGNTLRIGVSFQRDLSMQPNLAEVYWDYGYDHGYTDYRIIRMKDKHDSFVPLLMEKGWHSTRLEQILGRSVYRLTYFEGIHAVEDGIRDYNKKNKLGIKINADDFFNGKVYS